MGGELRYHALRDEWVIVAPGRADRPHPSTPQRAERPRAGHEPDCPFCPGNESETPDPLLLIPEETEGVWRVRVVPNKYPALTRDSGPEETAPAAVGSPEFRQRPGRGRHEVIVETPEHDGRFEELGPDHLREVLGAYRARFAEAAADPHIRHVVLFRNHGPGAGASLPHPHGQLIGLPFVPLEIERIAARALDHLRGRGRSLLLDVVEAELRADVRVVDSTEGFVAFVPFAAASPYEVWVAPRFVPPPFDQVGDERLAEFGGLLQGVIRRIRTVLDDPDYNLILQTPPFGPQEPPAYPWYAEIVPRFASIAGFEIGVGLRINVASPEAAAERLREPRSP